MYQQSDDDYAFLAIHNHRLYYNDAAPAVDVEVEVEVVEDARVKKNAIDASI